MYNTLGIKESRERTAMPISDRLRMIRQKKGWTQNHLAEVSGIPQPSIWRLEKGLILNPKSGLLQRLAVALEVSMEDLLREEDGESFDAILRHDQVGQAVLRGYESLSDQGKQQLRSFVQWLTEEEKKKGGKPHA
jgi:transcriptional regulator with XRE-family HTH domain